MKKNNQKSLVKLSTEQLKDLERNLELECYFLDKQMEKTHTENKIIKRELHKRKSSSIDMKPQESSKSLYETDMRRFLEEQLKSKQPSDEIGKYVEAYIKYNDQILDKQIKELKEQKAILSNPIQLKMPHFAGVAPSDVKDMQSLFIDCLNAYQRGKYASNEGRPSTNASIHKEDRKVSEMVKLLLSDQQILLSFIDLMFANQE